MQNKGYIILVTVIIVGFILIGLSVIGFTISLSNTSTLITNYSGATNYYIYRSCLEDSLYNLKQNNNFSTNTNIVINGGNCSYIIVNNGGQSRTINIESVFGNYTKRYIVQISTLNPNIIISTIEEVNTF